MKTADLTSWTATQFKNEYNDEIEMEIIRFSNHYQVTVNICDNQPPFRDITVTATHPRSKRKAAHKALKELYELAYPELFTR